MDNTLELENRWSLTQKTGFRFIFLAFFLFIIIFNNGVSPLLILALKYPLGLFQQFVPWFSKQYLGLLKDASMHYSGSGDTLFHYVSLLLVALFSIIGTIIWTVIDRKAVHYNQLYYWLTVAIRFYLATMLLNYGLVKFAKTQFPFPSLIQLTQNYGESNSMGLAWNFFGVSKGYNLFIGIAELFACLLFFRKTVTIGAFLSLMTTANIMAINYFYNVPVKMLSTALFIFCLFLLIPNFKRLIAFFFKGQAVALKIMPAPTIKKKWFLYAKYTLKYAFIILAIVTGLAHMYEMKEPYANIMVKPPLYGAYRIDSITKNDETTPTDLGWKLLLIGAEYESGLRYQNDDVERGKINVDTLKKKIEINFSNDNSTHHFSYTIPSPDHLTLRGKFYNDSVNVELTRKEFTLVTSDFNWIKE
ncbi:hypothetical protein DBR11_07055 [Pedobacter sp. HMWF019]|uniref:hypothetical protein n=1 Tax=Pedobacter sp. HMWF019 TaxID=2056856 RepID=UPI000D3C0F5D|nr:hypothetical protein [Pedobacter sp. HMWF019]PTT01554.1 hypothetical protein DBR11_07055 [Pedobacter sp. HMWF019]